MGVIYKIKMRLFKQKWRANNPHNGTSVRNMFPIENVSVGNNTYGEIGILIFNKEYQLHIGNYCSIGPNVQFLLSADHYLNRISTFPFKTKMLDEEMEGIGKGDIVIEDDVWIGYGAIILSGVHIGQGAVVSAGAVVTHDVEPYSIVGGVPAQIIRNRFPNDVKNVLLKFDYGMLSKEMIMQHINDLYRPIDKDDYCRIEEIFDWFPQINE